MGRGLSLWGRGLARGEGAQTPGRGSSQQGHNPRTLSPFPPPAPGQALRPPVPTSPHSTGPPDPHPAHPSPPPLNPRGLLSAQFRHWDTGGCATPRRAPSPSPGSAEGDGGCEGHEAAQPHSHSGSQPGGRPPRPGGLRPAAVAEIFGVDLQEKGVESGAGPGAGKQPGQELGAGGELAVGAAENWGKRWGEGIQGGQDPMCMGGRPSVGAARSRLSTHLPICSQRQRLPSGVAMRVAWKGAQQYRATQSW